MVKKDSNEDTNKSTKDMGKPGPDLPENAGSIDRLPVMIHSQYIKDMSVENPNTALQLRAAEGKPSIDVDFAMDARKMESQDQENSPDDAYEVILTVSAHARKGELTSFIVELQYGMLVTLQDVPEDKVHPLLLIEMPNYMFPYVRQIVSDMTAHAGYMPFYLSPVNFKALYRQRFGGPKANTPKKKAAENA